MKKLILFFLLSFITLYSGYVTYAVADSKTITNSIGIEFVLIPAGSFMQGCDKNFEECDSDETPRHRVTISKPFYIGKYEVTQEQWTAIMGSNPSKFKGRSNPVEQVSWDDARSFIRKLNQNEGTDAYRLPTEAEWEYAARAGSQRAYCYGDDKDRLGQYAWFDIDSEKGTTKPVGQLQPNVWGLYDMHGNVWEWCQDWKGDYSSGSVTDPAGPSSGSNRVYRGGGWNCYARSCRSACRGSFSPDYRDRDLGFRLVRTP